jgi:hypothetical protein
MLYYKAKLLGKLDGMREKKNDITGKLFTAHEAKMAAPCSLCLDLLNILL